MQLIDLSVTMEPTEGEPVPVQIEYVNHQEGADLLGKPAGIDHTAFPDGIGLSIEFVKLTTHSGTHIDAPAHYGPLSEGKTAKTIEDLPLDWFFHDGVLIDCSECPADETITSAEIEQKLATMKYDIKPYDIVLLRTGADKYWGKAEYFTKFRGVTREATEWLVLRGVKVIGIDSFGFDAPFHRMLSEYQEKQQSDVLWPAHLYGREKEYCQIERLANLDKIPVNTGFTVACFPIKVRNCGAGWSRVVAMIKN
ncbi:putative metal-dependent hydrolase [Cylindrospermum stagnale PCC 7417]|uniref:Putative metal-dependent hydrolase n=1 Tax=Cylindrospermum stagnale PCC 7417 TaxID=56107 RepID=K9WQE9_9NOST|nr:cyclase family protein [Cylindrospermum stagnale]AFZ22408.1 putative metal-dependent hydrolase [Cylindrospermum stagnale PCC 7417]